MNIKDLNKVAALVKDKQAWDAFLFLLDNMQLKLIDGLVGKPEVNELIRISAQYNLIQTLRKARDNCLALEKELHN